MNRGFSLVESLVALALTGLVAAAIQSYSMAVAKNVRLYGVIGEREETASLGLHLIAQELRGAGFSPHGGLASRIEVAEEHRVVIAHDWNGDGDSDDPTERIGFQLSANRRVLQLRPGNGPAQPFIDGLAFDGARFEFYDAEGDVLTVPVSPLERALVRRIDVHLELTISCSQPPCPTTLRRATSVHLRNG